MQLFTGSRLVAESLRVRVDCLLAEQQQLTPRGLAQRLIRQKVLSVWQGQQLLLGHAAFYCNEYKILEHRQCDADVVTYVAEDIRSQRLVACQLDRRTKGGGEDSAMLQPLFAWWKDRRHAHLIALRGIPSADHADSVNVVVLDYEEGPILSEVVRKNGPFPWRQAARLVAQFTELLQHTQPIWLARPLELKDFQLGQSGHLRWNPLSSMLSSLTASTTGEECRWGQQAGLLFLMLVSDASAAEWLLRFQRRRAVTLMSDPAWKQLPQDVQQMIERLVTTKAVGLARTAAWFREQSVSVPGTMMQVPGRLHRSQLHHLLRRTPTWGTVTLPTCRWNDLTGNDVSTTGANSRKLPEQGDDLDPPEILDQTGRDQPRRDQPVEVSTLVSPRTRTKPGDSCHLLPLRWADSSPWKPLGAVRWWLYLTLWGIVMVLACTVWWQQELQRSPEAPTLSMSGLGDTMNW